MPLYDIDENAYKRFLLSRIRALFIEKYRITNYVYVQYLNENTSVHILNLILDFLEFNRVIPTDDPDDNCVYGWCYMNIGSINNAIIYYENAAKAGNVNAMIETANCYNQLHMYDNAEKYYLEAIKNSNSSIYSHHIASFYHMHKEKALTKKYALDGLERKIIELREENKNANINNTDATVNVPRIGSPSPTRAFLRYGMDKEDYAKLCDVALKHVYPSVIEDIKFADEERNYIKLSDLLDNIFTDETLNILSTKTSEEIMKFPKIYRIIYNLLKTSLEPIKLHFEYSMTGKGYQDAEKDFIGIVNNTNNNTN